MNSLNKLGARVSVAAAKSFPRAGVAPSLYVREAELRMNILGGIGATTLRRLIDSEGFPPPRKLSERILAWERAAVVEWVESRQAQSANIEPGANPGATKARPWKAHGAPVTLAAEGAASKLEGAKGGGK